MALENRSGQMVQSILVNGAIIVHTARESLFMLTEMCMKDSGLMIKQMDPELIFMSMEQSMKVNGRTICSMERAQKHGQINQDMKEIINLDANMASAPICGTMAANTLVTGEKIRFLVLVSTHGSTEDDMKENGSKITWKAWEYTSGTMVVCIKASIKMTKNMASVFIHGLMDAVTKDTGTEENSMD
eukprot:CAMPEP_0116881788 /NCGR_PEP_ID=MMETSP0463-20121206/13844_1 /TAXON_ID=181622 /ORGANISM="Strombidinopsis sp, Strain SopsisLIS2011" /LENGTH=186 /DNA_ID=CAMNT_0004533971 /DNA_START=446 /DNA_END=1006 /DNA_ORIENTATION=-